MFCSAAPSNDTTDVRRHRRRRRQIQAAARSAHDGEHRARLVAIATEWRRLASNAAEAIRTDSAAV
jgi:biotin synthase-like enzyme